MKTYQSMVTNTISSPQKQLNPKLWNSDGSLQSMVRSEIIEKARAFVQKLGLPADSLEDIRLVGSNAGFNYDNDSSDLDATLMLKRDLNLSKEEVRRLGRASTYLTYKLSPSINGIDLNFYVSSRNLGGLRPANQNIYSMFKQEFLIGPTKYSESAPNYIASRAAEWINQIEACADDDDGDADECAERLLKKLRTYRISGLRSASGENSTPALVWKVLSRSGYVAKLKESVDKLEKDFFQIKTPTQRMGLLNNEDYKLLVKGAEMPYAIAKWNKRILLGEDPERIIKRLRPIIALLLSLD